MRIYFTKKKKEKKELVNAFIYKMLPILFNLASMIVGLMTVFHRIDMFYFKFNCLLLNSFF